MRLFFASVCLSLATASSGVAQQVDAPTKTVAMLTRPDVSTWPTIGFTMRTDPKNPQIPAQWRQVQMETGDYQDFLRTRNFADGTRFGVMFYSVGLDSSFSPPFYHANKQTAFALEVIDRGHVDGRRFYVFNGPSQQASPLPPGNECAACHKARGTFDGTFAPLYPLISSQIATDAQAAASL